MAKAPQPNLPLKGDLDGRADEQFESDTGAEVIKPDTIDESEIKRLLSAPISYQEFGGSEKTLKLSAQDVREVIAAPTKSGQHPTDRQIALFMRLCEYRGINPFVGDAYLIGFDTAQGPQYHSVVAVQALWKRAEMNPRYRGHKSGAIIYKRGEDEVRRIDGIIFPERAQDDQGKIFSLVGAWSEIYRSDRDVPECCEVKLSAVCKTIERNGVSRAQGQWATDPAGMAEKCANAKGLRQAFPSEVGGMYATEEIGAIENTLRNQGD